MVLHCICINKPVDVCKKSPPPHGAKNQHVNITKDVCKKSHRQPVIFGSRPVFDVPVIPCSLCSSSVGSHYTASGLAL